MDDNVRRSVEAYIEDKIGYLKYFSKGADKDTAIEMLQDVWNYVHSY